jgi:hypothetical protein
MKTSRSLKKEKSGELSVCTLRLSEKLNGQQKILAHRLAGEGTSTKAVAQTFDVHFDTIYRLLQAMSRLTPSAVFCSIPP